MNKSLIDRQEKTNPSPENEEPIIDLENEQQSIPKMRINPENEDINLENEDTS